MGLHTEARTDSYSTQLKPHCPPWYHYAVSWGFFCVFFFCFSLLLLLLSLCVCVLRKHVCTSGGPCIRTPGPHALRVMSHHMLAFICPGWASKSATWKSTVVTVDGGAGVELTRSTAGSWCVGAVCSGLRYSSDLNHFCDEMCERLWYIRNGYKKVYSQRILVNTSILTVKLYCSVNAFGLKPGPPVVSSISSLGCECEFCRDCYLV